MVRGVHFQLRRASYKEKGKSGVALKILSYFPNTDARRSIGPATTDAKRRRRLTSPLPRPWYALECPLSAHSKAGQSKDATNCCPAEGRAAWPGCGCLVLLCPAPPLFFHVIICHFLSSLQAEILYPSGLNSDTKRQPSLIAVFSLLSPTPRYPTSNHSFPNSHSALLLLSVWSCVMIIWAGVSSPIWTVSFLRTYSP